MSSESIFKANAHSELGTESSFQKNESIKNSDTAWETQTIKSKSPQSINMKPNVF